MVEIEYIMLKHYIIYLELEISNIVITSVNIQKQWCKIQTKSRDYEKIKIK